MKIGLIAMSGIRACDQELLELGLTLPGFVERSETIASLPSLGLLTLAGMTPPEHDLFYFELADIEGAHRLPADFDLVAISSFTAQARESYEFAKRFVARDIPVVMGGLHVTSVPEEAQKLGVTAVAGEGELVWREILVDAENARLKPFYDARGAEFDLGAAPMPAFELLDHDAYNRLTVQTSRGCPWKCSFCASSILLTSRYKQKPAEKVLAEIDKIRTLWNHPLIEFADDNGLVNASYWRQLLPELAARRVRWFTETDLSVADDPQLLEALSDAGCVELLIGFESPTSRALNGIEMKRNWKRRQWPRYKEVIRQIQSHGIRVNACFVLGLDGHTTEVFDELYSFVEDAVPFDVQITYPTPFPNTPLYTELKAAGRLLHDGEWERCTLFDINFEPDGMTREELRRGFHELTKKLYNESFTDWRRQRFQRDLRRWRREHKVPGACVA